MYNITRSVERIKGVKTVSFDINKGLGRLTFRPGKSVDAEDIWKALQKSGFTPVKIEVRGEVYAGPKQ